MLPNLPASRSEGTGKEDEDFTIQGSNATDIEWRVALALEKLKIPYMFQFQLMGGRSTRGGIVLDFLALTDPLSTPIDVRGDYWHQPSQQVDDDLALAIMMSRGQYAEPVVLYGGELQTEEMAYSAVRRELRV